MRATIHALLVLVLCVPATVSAQPVGEIIVISRAPIDVFATVDAPADWLAEEASDDNGRPVLQQRVVRFDSARPGGIFNPGRATPFEFRMEFMDGVVERVVIEHVEDVTRDGITLRRVSGRVKKDNLSRINLVFSDRQVRGAVHYGDTVIEFRPVKSNLTVIQRLDPRGFPREFPPRVAHRQPGFVVKQPAIGFMLTNAAADLPAEPFDGEPYADETYIAPEITILVVKSDDNPGCSNALLTQDALTYQQSLNDAFSPYATSQVEFRCIDQSEEWHTLEEARQFLRDDPNVNDLRDELEADLVVLFVKDGMGSCGYTMHPDYPLYPIDIYVAEYALTAAFAVVDEACATANLSFEHEIGHLLGMKHDRFNELGGLSDFWGYGYPGMQMHRPVKRSIMAYESYCTYVGTTCSRTPDFFYSIPRKKSGGPFGWLANLIHKCFGLIKGKSRDSTGDHFLDKSANDALQIVVAAGLVATYSEQ